MNTRLTNIAFLFVSTLWLTIAAQSAVEETDLEKLFDEWMESFNKEYKSSEEKEKRMKIWIENNEFIEGHNSLSPSPSYTLGHNQFSDMTEDEILQYNNLGPYAEEHKELDVESNEKLFAQIETDVSKSVKTNGRRLNENLQDFLPNYVNWHERGYVTPVKDQKACGSCWDFSAIGVLESAHAIETGQLVSLSEQEILDCDDTNNGCNGGWPNRVFEYVQDELDGVCTENSYPYLATKDQTDCEPMKDKCDKVSHTKVLLHGMLPKSEYALKLGLNRMPISVAINANVRAFHFYKSGVFDTNCSAKTLDHAVLAVGYSSKDNQEGYWLIKNSWGVDWGMNGYIKMAIESFNKSNEGQCGIYKALSTAITI